MAKKTSKRKTLNILDKNKKHSQFDYTEIFRHIRTNIEFSTVDKDIKSICITSSQAGETKTTLSINLAYIFATKYNRVLLIDCDLRKNTLHKYMGLSNKHGLTDALLEYRQTKKLNVEYFQSVKDPSFAGTMAVLTSGIHIPNPSELLGSHVFKDYINELKTGALIEASMMMGAALAGARENDIKLIEKAGSYIGKAFQIQDDILDVTSTSEVLGKNVLSDEKNHKSTYVNLLGIDGASQKVKELSEEALRIIDSFDNKNEFLTELIESLIYRKK